MKTKHNHTWLFAFTDLAFLLLISLSLIPEAPRDIFVHFAEMDVPSVPSNPALSPIHDSNEIWELRVFARSQRHPTPFKLVRVRMDRKDSPVLYFKSPERDELASELESLKKRNIRPVLVPQKESLTDDFLFAAGLISTVWAGEKSQTIVSQTHLQE